MGSDFRVSGKRRFGTHRDLIRNSQGVTKVTLTKHRPTRGMMLKDSSGQQKTLVYSAYFAVLGVATAKSVTA